MAGPPQSILGAEEGERFLNMVQVDAATEENLLNFGGLSDQVHLKSVSIANLVRQVLVSRWHLFEAEYLISSFELSSNVSITKLA